MRYVEVPLAWHLVYAYGDCAAADLALNIAREHLPDAELHDTLDEPGCRRYRFTAA